jgi:uncharacterized protein YvpB
MKLIDIFVIIVLVTMFGIITSGNLPGRLKSPEFIITPRITRGTGGAFSMTLRSRYQPNVPLDPFTAPLIKYPYSGKVLSFLLYSPKFLVPIRDQGICGSCYAFSIADMLADRVSIYSSGEINNLLSVQQIISCSTNEGCGGESPDSVLQWMERTDFMLTLENNMLYKQMNSNNVTTRCSNVRYTGESGQSVGITNVVSLTEFIREDTYSSSKLEQNIKNMKMELLTNGPFYAAMSVYDSFYDYDGTRPYEKKKLDSLAGGHAVEIIGYCDKSIDHRDNFTKGYWIVRNSWSKDFPKNSKDTGYFTITMGQNECGIESRCGSAIPVFLNTDNSACRNISNSRFESFDEFYERRRGRYT